MTDMTLQLPTCEAELPDGLGELDRLVDRQIRAFLDGSSAGDELLQGLYGGVIDEPIPPQLTALLRRRPRCVP
jgi:hypothetical protein